MAPSSSSSSAATSVQVALRIRPPTTQDSTSIPARFQRSVIQATSTTSISIESPSSSLAGAGAPASPGPSNAANSKKQSFTFDQVHPPPTTQYELFESTAKPLVSRFLEGFNCTILAYGQTSSGKTFTMTGIDLDADPADPNNHMGIIPRAVSTMFSRARQIKEERAGAWNYSVKGSFIEVYNEDLIDLLSSDDLTGAKREVQIREDKDGHIIWGGLREVNVKNANDVMSLIKKGTAIRRTNETDMNAQSSRSHAIFSLTLTQKKFTGTGHPPRSPSPAPPGGRSPSRLQRPGSMYAGGPTATNTRISSPTFGRPSTPSFASAMNRGGGLRPASALGQLGGERTSNSIDEEAGEWVTIVSKFHFVDLAGSERLKRTAAAGERIKEGISINSGLLALGNVISALGDPARAKSNTATHIPYRDSKLTRLLQDSLGGNAHTLMIACVSPAEWNAAETINTLKYANRARNIKNRAVVNEKEDGWDDVEWLQSTVTRLRKEVKAIKDGGMPTSGGREPELLEGAGKKVLAQMTELQNNYEDLREKFSERTEELTRLRRELGERHRSSTAGNITGTAKYEEIVGPVIEEYEKTISAMEAELSLNRAALRHTNEMVEEKEEELAVITDRHAATELYVEELRSRVAKLTEREASTEAYVRDLEEKMKAYDETTISSSESMSDLRREIGRLKDTEAHSTKYIAELEARLLRSDESILSLQQTVERLEKESDRRQEEIESLKSRLESLRQDGENWRSDLEDREAKVKQLEEKMLEWDKRRQEAGEVRARLGGVVEEVASARRSLEVDLANVPSITPSPQATTPILKPETLTDDIDSSSKYSTAKLENQLLALQQTHTATLADLSSVSAKYRDALREISDLAAQIQEAKLSNASGAESGTESAVDRPQEIPPFRRRVTSPRNRDETPISASSRRLFFRQAASTESLHARSLSQSQSLSQELSSAHLRKASFSSHGTSSSHSPSSSHSGSNSLSTLQSFGHRPNLSISMPSLSPVAHERSVSSLEQEIMRLQEVLKEREAEITVLEDSLKGIQQEKITNNGITIGEKLAQPSTVDGALSPQTLYQFDSIRKTMENGNGIVNGAESASSFSDDESLERLNELMLSMAQKESQHREIVDSLNSQLSQTRRQLDDLTALSRDQALNMSMEIEALQRNHSEDLLQLEEVRKREADLIASLKQLKVSHQEDLEQLRGQHEEALAVKAAQVESLISSLKQNHQAETASLRAELETAVNTLNKAQEEHTSAFGKLERSLQLKIQEANNCLEESKAEHQRIVDQLMAEHAATLRQKDSEAAVSLQTTDGQYYDALTTLRTKHAQEIDCLRTEMNATIERLREEHAGELRMAEIAKEGSLSESETASAATLKTLQDEHAAAIARKEASFAEEISNLNAGFIRVGKAKEEDHILQLDRLRLEHGTLVSKLKSEWQAEMEALQSKLRDEKHLHEASILKLRQEQEIALDKVREQHAAVLQEVENGHKDDVDKIKLNHASAVQELLAKAEDERASVLCSHSNTTLELKQHYEERISQLEASTITQQQEHQQELESVKATGARSLTDEQTRFQNVIEDLKRQQVKAEAASRKERDALLEELETHKAAAAEALLAREQIRQQLDLAIAEKDQVTDVFSRQLSASALEKEELQFEVASLHAELDRTRSEQSKLVQEASKRESLVGELERHRSVLAEMQENLQRVKDEKDVLQTEKNRSDNLVRDLQAQLARSASPPNIRSPDRSLSFPRGNALPGIKLPPPTPPPSMPPPPAPRAINGQHLNGESNLSTSSQGSNFTSSASSRESQPESPSTSVSQITPINGLPSPSIDPKLSMKLEQQMKLAEEQEAMIKTLNKQLTHCETDLQTHMDLVMKLETSLGDSEKNLRKARMQATEIARERDTLNVKLEALRNELTEAKREVINVRRSIIEEKQTLEQRLDEERKAKERVRQQLDSRTEELQRRRSKFTCI
ncbi:kinesin domain-containing protein [Panaeolus papilionaceus]|nr:kinesin domain-containing protein [Panaeolus papilionaceus]